MNDSWLLTYGFLVTKWAVLSMFISILLAFLVKMLKCNCNIWHIPRNIYRFFIYLKRGRRFIGNIKGTWRIIKGTVSSSGYLHTDTIFPEGTTFCLSEYEFRKIKVTDSDDEIRKRIIDLNLHDLKKFHPFSNRLSGRAQDPFAEEHRPRRIMMNDSFEETLGHISPEMRRIIERQLLPEGLVSDEDEHA
jgi:hypothetical protein